MGLVALAYYDRLHALHVLVALLGSRLAERRACAIVCNREIVCAMGVSMVWETYQEGVRANVGAVADHAGPELEQRLVLRSRCDPFWSRARPQLRVPT